MMTYIKAGGSLRLDSQACVACGMCLEVCPHAVFAPGLDAAGSGKPSIAYRERCMECGACRQNCPASAISVDSGVGCVAAIMNSVFRGGEVSCDCDKGGKSCC